MASTFTAMRCVRSSTRVPHSVLTAPSKAGPACDRPILQLSHSTQAPCTPAPAHHTSPVRTHASSPTESSFCSLPPACPLFKLQSIELIMGWLALPTSRSACPLRRDGVSHARSITPHTAATASTPTPTPTLTSPLARADSTSFAIEASMHAAEVCRTNVVPRPGLTNTRIATLSEPR